MGDWVRDLIEHGGVLTVALLMFLETIFPPIPSEIIMSLSGVQAARGTMNLYAAIVAGSAGAMAGNAAWYAFARWLGTDRFHPLIDRYGRWLTIDWRSVKRADALFDRYDRWFVFLGRMVPTIRSLVSIPAGLFEMPWRSFLIWSTLGTAGWTAALAVAGYQLGTRFDQIDRWLGPVSNGVLAVLVLAYLYRVATWRKRER